MTDDLDRFQREIIAAALRDDQEALRENTQSLIVTCRQLRNELEQARQEQRIIVQAAEQGIVALSDALARAGAELEAARVVVEAAREYLDCSCSHGVHWFDIGGEAEGEVCDLRIELDDQLRAFAAMKESQKQ